ncbi:MAG: response regulator, partial [bacterium]|nr:response regulator [bacterium]
MEKASILIVEDEWIIAEDIRRSLEAKGYAVTAIVSKAEDAVETALSQKPDLVLMDILLDGEMDGIEAAGIIREQSGIPVVYLSANATPGILDRAKISASYGYVLKPFKPRELHSNIEMAIHKSRLDRRIQRLNDVLEISRKVDRLISRERDRGRLLKGICDLFTLHKGYRSAWIFLVDPAGAITYWAESGEIDAIFQSLLAEMEKGKFPACIQQAMEAATPHTFVINDISGTCTGCVLHDKKHYEQVLTSALAFEKSLFGVICVGLLGDVAIDDSETSLFKDTASDISFALHTMKIEEERKQAEGEL